MNNINVYLKEIIIPIQSGPLTYEVETTGYGFIVEQCDDPSAIIQIDSETVEPFSLTRISQLIFPHQFHLLYITNFNIIEQNQSPIIKMLIITNPKMQIATTAPFQNIVNSVKSTNIYTLQGSGSTTRYALWSVDASISTPSTFTDINQQYFPDIPLIQYVQPLKMADSSTFTIATTALSDISSITPVAQTGISTEFFQAGDTIPIMGYSVILTPLTTASGTNTFLIGIQQPLSPLQQIQLNNLA